MVGTRLSNRMCKPVIGGFWKKSKAFCTQCQENVIQIDSLIPKYLRWMDYDVIVRKMFMAHFIKCTCSYSVNTI